MARRPHGQRQDGPRPATTPQDTRTPPQYPHTPRWGLVDLPPLPPNAQPTPLAYFANRAEPLLIVTAMLFVLAAVAEAFRYGVLLRNRSDLIEQWVLTCSDAAVWSTSIVALLVALIAALGAIGWLIRARADEFERRGRTDPRTPAALVAGCVVPALNLLAPGVFLTELTHGRTRAQRVTVRIWWCAWLFGAAMALAALVWRTADSLQAQSDGVVFTAVTDLVAAGVAVVTIATIRALEGRDLRGRPRHTKRWLIATGPHRPVIEPVRGVVDKVEGDRGEVEPAAAEPDDDTSTADDRAKVVAQ